MTCESLQDLFLFARNNISLKVDAVGFFFFQDFRVLKVIVRAGGGNDPKK